MIIIKKKPINVLSVFWFIKIIFDMFYQLKLLTIISFLVSLILLIRAMVKSKLKFNKIDIPITILILLFTFSFLKSPGYYLDYFKIISSFILYFLGRFYYKDFELCNKTLKSSLFLALIVNLVVCLIGKGSIKWGDALTYRGLYYFKTDFACMLTTFLVFYLFSLDKIKLKNMIAIIMAIVLILLANARIYYIITMIIFFMFFFYRTESNKNIFSMKHFAVLIIIIFSSLFLIRGLSNLTFFKERNMLGISFDNISDLYDAANTQGRSVIWTHLLNIFSQQNFLTRFFGASLAFNDLNSFRGFTEHSLYIKVLLNTGYIGISVFVIFILKTLKNISHQKNTKLAYITFLLFLIYLISGISSPTILYTNSSWIPMFYIGICITTKREKS